MSLVIEKNGTVDNRMVEYDRAVVQLGLDKAALEAEVDRIRKEVQQMVLNSKITESNLGKDHNELVLKYEKEIRAKKRILSEYEDSLLVYQEVIESIIEQKEYAEKVIANKQEKSILFDEELVLKQKKVSLVDEEIISLNRKRDSLVVETRNDQIVLSKINDNIERSKTELHIIDEQKSESKRELEDTTKKLIELQDIISVLTSANTEGLDLVASFDSERKRLKAKEELLDTVRNDLIKYAQRLQKEREKAGIITPMTLPDFIDK